MTKALDFQTPLTFLKLIWQWGRGGGPATFGCSWPLYGALGNLAVKLMFAFVCDVFNFHGHGVIPNLFKFDF